MDHKTESAYSPNRRPLSAPWTDQPSRHAIPPSPAASNAPTKPCLWGPPTSLHVFSSLAARLEG